MEYESYRKRFASKKFKREQDAEIYAVPYESWKEYKATHPDYFGTEDAVILQDLDSERFRRTLRVNGESYHFILWRGSVCNLAVDAIVNAANESLLGGGGVDGAIHDAAGYLLTRECADKYTEVDTCGTVITKGYNLPADFVIHTVGPVYYHEREGAQEKLALCYNRCFELCEQHHLSSLGLCCVSCGIYGYPPENASYVAINEALNWCRSGRSYPRTFVFVTFNSTETEAYQAAFKELIQAAPDDLLPLPEPTTVIESGDSQPTTQTTSAAVAHSSPVGDKPEEVKAAPQSKVTIEERQEFKRRHADDFRPSEGQEIVDLERLKNSCKKNEGDREFTFYVAEVNLLQLKVNAVITGNGDAMVKAGAKLFEQDFTRLKGKPMRPLKEYQLQFDYVVVGAMGATEEPEVLNTCYRDCLSACDDLPIQSLAISALSTSDAAPIIAVQETLNWIKKPETKVRTVVFAATSEEQARVYYEELQKGFEPPKTE